MVLIGYNTGISQWFSAVFNGSHWYLVVLSGSRWFSLVLIDYHTMILYVVLFELLYTCTTTLMLLVNNIKSPKKMQYEIVQPVLR